MARLDPHSHADSAQPRARHLRLRLAVDFDARRIEGEAALRDLEVAHAPSTRAAREPEPAPASLTRTGNVWSVSWGAEAGNLPHLKGLADIAALVRHRGRDVSALQLVGGASVGQIGSDDLIDVETLRAYRRRLAELDREIELATDDHSGRVETLQRERDQVLAEVARTTGLGGRIRTSANNPAERARKAVSGRIRDALRQLETVAPVLAAHLDRSIQTGLHCSYRPVAEDSSIRWVVKG